VSSAFTAPLSTNGNKWSNRSEDFLSFSRTNPLAPLHAQGKATEQRHGRARACAAVEEQRRNRHGSLWRYGMEPVQLQRGRLPGPSRASSAEVLYHRLIGVGTCRLSPLLHSPPSLAAVAAVQTDTALRRLEMRLCSRCQYCGAHFSEKAAFGYCSCARAW